MRRHHSATTGMNIATTGVLFRKALIATTGTIRRTWACRTPLGRPITRVEIQEIPPVSCSPTTTT